MPGIAIASPVCYFLFALLMRNNKLKYHSFEGPVILFGFQGLIQSTNHIIYNFQLTPY